MPADSAPRYLVVGPAWVGDMVMAQSLFIRLRQQHPEARIDVLAPSWSLPLVARMPEVHRGISLAVGHGRFGLAERYRLGRSLRTEHYDRAIVLPRSFKSALVPLFARIPRRTGYRGEMRYGLLNDMRELDRAVLTRTVQRQVALGQPADAPQPPATPFPRLRIDPANQQRLMGRLQLQPDRPVVALLPGAEYGPAKQWPLAHWRQLAGELIGAGHQVWVLGSDRDRAAGEFITEGLAEARNLAGQTELVDTVDLLALCAHAVSNDSGLMHIACATGLPVTALYGSSSPDYTPPLSDRATAIWLKLDCSPCFKRECPLGHTRCLTDIRVQKVLQTVLAEDEAG